jgi:hypothetical protein
MAMNTDGKHCYAEAAACALLPESPFLVPPSCAPAPGLCVKQSGTLVRFLPNFGPR